MEPYLDQRDEKANDLRWTFGISGAKTKGYWGTALTLVCFRTKECWGLALDKLLCEALIRQALSLHTADAVSVLVATGDECLCREED